MQMARGGGVKRRGKGVRGEEGREGSLRVKGKGVSQRGSGSES